MDLDKLNKLANQARDLIKPIENSNKEWYRIEDADSERAKLYIYGPIGEYFGEDDVVPGSFITALNDITAPAIDLHINSPGGFIFDGVAIYSGLREHESTIDVSVDGVAASAASFVAMAGDSVGIQKPAKMMIHDGRGLVLGSSEDMRQMADLLDQLSDTIAEIYSDRAGGTVNSWREKMKAETWFSASQAVEAGLADKVLGETAMAENRHSQLIRARARVGGLTA